MAFSEGCHASSADRARKIENSTFGKTLVARHTRHTTQMKQSIIYEQLTPPVEAARGLEACGPDLEYTPAYLDLFTLAAGKGEQQVGEIIHQAEEPDWAAVLRRGLKLLTESRDLRIAAITAHAALQQNGLSGLAELLEHIADWIEHDWEHLHPKIIIDGEYDPLLRANAIGSLADPEGLLRSMRSATLISAASGKLSLGDIDALVLGKPVSERCPASSVTDLVALLHREAAANEESLSGLRRVCTSLQAIDNLCQAQSPAEASPNLQPLLTLLKRVTDAIPSPSVEFDTAVQDTSPAVAESTHTNASSLPAKLTTRSDAFRALAIARTYFEQYEPSHPAPLLIKRIERLADLDFAAMIADLAPDGLNQLRHVTGITHN
jgi:type VI secretion system protein ImpA